MNFTPLCECTQSYKVLKEAGGNGQEYFLEGVFIQGNVINKNRRIYPLEILLPEVSRYNKEFISQDRAMGELDHIDSPIVMCKNASHKIISLTQDGDNFIGKLKVMRSVPNGQILAGLIDEGIRLGVSTRGYGSVKEDRSKGASVVQSDFNLSTIDVVSDPSAQKALVDAIMEGRDWAWIKEKHAREVKRQLDRKANLSESDVLKLAKRYLSTL